MPRTALALLALTLTISGCSSGAETPKPSIDGLQTFTEEPKPLHKEGPVTYDHTPPAGGTHWTAWLRCGVYTAPVPNEFAVHSQEHGAVWLTYLPDASAADIARIAALADLNKEYVLVSPYPGQPGKFMASTWGAQLSVDKADDERLATFVKEYAGGGQGGEKGADCTHGLLPAEAQAELDKASN
ncbi:MAG: DUF3105 domain-containing protein [Frankiaceae bacterium]|nr:DUF3105 domain-containing protein [Frankiaceae bacterium]